MTKFYCDEHLEIEGWVEYFHDNRMRGAIQFDCSLHAVYETVIYGQLTSFFEETQTRPFGLYILPPVHVQIFINAPWTHWLPMEQSVG